MGGPSLLCVFFTSPRFLLPVGIQHIQCPCRFFKSWRDAWANLCGHKVRARQRKYMKYDRECGKEFCLARRRHEEKIKYLPSFRRTREFVVCFLLGLLVIMCRTKTASGGHLCILRARCARCRRQRGEQPWKAVEGVNRSKSSRSYFLSLGRDCSFYKG